jgi:AcrR family transcriptional regulator
MPTQGRRPYRSPRRAEQAAQTRHAILQAARELIVERGYTRATIADIAARAGVAADTVYAAVGRKPVILRELVETSLSGGDEAVPAAQRDYVRRLQAAPDGETKLGIYAAAVAEIMPRLVPIFLALRDAAVEDHDCRALWAEISTRRARNMLELAADLRVTGQIRPDLSDQQVADIVWSMNAPEYVELLTVQRGWTAEEVGAFLRDAWVRVLLRP